MPTFRPGPAPQWRRGEYVVIPAQRSGATLARSSCRSDLQRKGFVHDDGVGVTAVGRRLPVLLEAVVGLDPAFLTKLLQAVLAAGAGPAGVDQDSNPGQIADPELRHLGADARDAAHDLVARHHGVDRVPPVIPRLVNVRVTHPAVENLDHHVSLAWGTPLEREWRERGLRSVSRVSV